MKEVLERTLIITDKQGYKTLIKFYENVQKSGDYPALNLLIYDAQIPSSTYGSLG